MPKSDETRLLDPLIKHYVSNIDDFKLLLEQLRGHVENNRGLSRYIHSMKWRVKDPEHLRDKLRRKLVEAKDAGKVFDYTVDNLFGRINDLAGFRILHLHTRQMGDLDQALKACLHEAMYPLMEGPRARTWDDETRDYFESIGIETIASKTLYTSVHYVIETSRRTKYTCEIQVRTLAEELWGETDHTINYPHPTNSMTCREQIATLARITSACSRLTDSIFSSHTEHVAREKDAAGMQGMRPPRGKKGSTVIDTGNLVVGLRHRRCFVASSSMRLRGPAQDRVRCIA